MRITPRKFLVEDFAPDQQGWIGPLISPLNGIIQEIVTGLENNITLDNLYQEVKEVKVINETTNFPLKFKTKFNKQPVGFQVVYCTASTGAMPTAYPWPVWTYANQQITVTSISGLTASLTYTIRFHIIYG